MAARQIPRRILSFLISNPPPPPRQPRILSSRAEPFSQILPEANSRFQRVGLGRRGLQTIAEAVEESDKLKSDSISTSTVSSPVANEDSLKHRVTSTLKISSSHDLAMIFTCKVCETRSVKTVSKVSYEKGVVLARCGGCNNIHLIADRLGWFGEPGSVEEFLAARGEEVKKGSADTINLTLEDLTGKDKLDV